jgi:2-enoate reductase
MADCAVNYEVMREKEYRYAMERPATAKKVAIVGGGVAGMEAARIATLRGHEVTLYEKSDRLGGIIPSVADMPKLYMHELNNIVKYLTRELERLGVKVKLNTEVDAALLSKAAPDAVILATGSKDAVPDIPGVDGPNVVTLLQYLRKEGEIGDTVGVLGGHEGAEAAVSLARQGKDVTILEEDDHIADATFLKYVGRQLLLQRYLDEEGVKVLTDAKVEKMGENSVTYTHDGKREELGFDTLLLALGREPHDRLASDLADTVPELYKIGDCLEPHSVRHSIHSASRAALDI